MLSFQQNRLSFYSLKVYHSIASYYIKNTACKINLVILKKGF